MERNLICCRSSFEDPDWRYSEMTLRPTPSCNGTRYKFLVGLPSRGFLCNASKQQAVSNFVTGVGGITVPADVLPVTVNLHVRAGTGSKQPRRGGDPEAPGRMLYAWAAS